MSPQVFMSGIPGQVPNIPVHKPAESAQSAQTVSGQQPSGPQDVTNLPVNINVGNISGNSGIYVGKSVTLFGFSSHSKSNAGVGDIGNSNLFYKSVSYVYDPDVIDTPIDDRDVHILQQQPAKGKDLSQTNIGVGTVWVNTIQQNAGTFIGTTSITGMDSHEKQNLAHGQIFGNENMAYGGLYLTQDQDVIDAVMHDEDNKAGIFVSK